MKEFCVEVTRQYRVWIKAGSDEDIEEIIQATPEDDMELDDYEYEIIDEREIEDDEDFMIYDDIDDEEDAEGFDE